MLLVQLLGVFWAGLTVVSWVVSKGVVLAKFGRVQFLLATLLEALVRIILSEDLIFFPILETMLLCCIL